MAAWMGHVLHALVAMQATQASIAGTVRDAESGVALPGATVFLVDLGRGATSDSVGRYHLRGVPAGPQHVAVRRIGYAPNSFHALVPASGVLDINVSLRPRPLELQAVRIRAAVPPPIRGLDDVDSTHFPDRSLTIGAVRNHPFLAEPDVLQALSGGDVRIRPESPNGIHVRGGASDHIAYLLDGIPIFSPYHAAGTFSAWNPDALSQVELHTSAPTPVFPEALSGAIAATTRTGAVQHEVQGSLSTTEARLTIDGPARGAGSGYLLSVRSAFPGFLSRAQEPSYLRNESGDWLGKIEWPLFGGSLRLLGYSSENEISAAGLAALDTVGRGAARHGLDWGSRSYGGEWVRPLSHSAAPAAPAALAAARRAELRVRTWAALSDVGASWRVLDSSSESLTSSRRDVGALVLLSLSGGENGGTGAVGLRTQRIGTSYTSVRDSPNARTIELDASTPVSTAFVTYSRPIRSRTTLDLALAGTVAAGTVHLSPRMQLRYRPNANLALTGSYSRLQQYAQSLRNPESVVSNIFPVDLYVAADNGRVPVARSEQGTLAVEYRPMPGVRIEAHGYARNFDGVLLVAPRDAAPFATSGFVQGAGDSRGVAIDASAQSSRIGLLLNYSLQRVRFRYGDSSYVPDHGATQTLDAGVIAFPSATVSLKLGVMSVMGRRTTTVRGPFEWEACNLLDRGCEFAGIPQTQVDRLGTTRLPPYVRVDFVARKHWHLRLAGRDALIGAFAAATNLLDRKNVLAVIVDPVSGRRSVVDMRPFAPLVFGLDWRY